LVDKNLVFAHELARKRLREAAERSRLYYNRSHKIRKVDHGIGELVWLKVGYMTAWEKKLTDKFEGPYYVITKWASGTYRVVFEEDELPKVVHQDRLRKCVQEIPQPTPDWVKALISQYNRHVLGTAQTQVTEQEMQDHDAEQQRLQDEADAHVSGEEAGESDDPGDGSRGSARSDNPINSDVSADLTIRCINCMSGKFDKFAIFRHIFRDGVCHLCREDQ